MTERTPETFSCDICGEHFGNRATLSRHKANLRGCMSYYEIKELKSVMEYMRQDFEKKETKLKAKIEALKEQLEEIQNGNMSGDELVIDDELAKMLETVKKDYDILNEKYKKEVLDKNAKIDSLTRANEILTLETAEQSKVIKKLENDLADKLVVCQGQYDEMVKSYQNENTELKSTFSILNTDIQALTKEKDDLTEENKQLKERMDEIERLTRENKQLKEQIEKVERLTEENKRLTTALQEHSANEQEITKLNEQLAKYRKNLQKDAHQHFLGR